MLFELCKPELLSRITAMAECETVINYCIFCMFREPVATGSFTPRDSRHPNERKQLPVRLVKRSSPIRLSNKKEE